jgi:hypothetical protein
MRASCRRLAVVTSGLRGQHVRVLECISRDRNSAHPQAHCVPYLAKQASDLAARHTAGEYAAAMASRIELPGSEHFVCDPARSKSTLHQTDHLFLRHRGRPPRLSR